MLFRWINSAMGECNHRNSESMAIYCSIVANQCDHRTTSPDKAPEKLFGIFMSLKNSGCDTIGYIVYLDKDLNLVLIHALVGVTFHHVVQGIFNCTSL